MTRKVFIWQEPPELTVAHMKKDAVIPVPHTVQVPSWNLIRQFPFKTLLDASQARELGLLVKPEDIVKYTFRPGDQITYDDNNLVTHLNGRSVAELIGQKRRSVVGVGAMPSDYPIFHLPLENYTCKVTTKSLPKDGNVIKNLRPLTLLAPWGKGQRGIIVAPPNGGKSVVFRMAWESSIQLTLDDSNVYVIGLHVGERAEDGTILQNILDECDGDKTRVELYQCPDGESERAHYEAALFVTERARRLVEMGWDVILLIDSFSRILLSHSRSGEIEKSKEGGLLSGGIHTDSIAATKRLLSIAGQYTIGSLTVIATMLMGKEGFRSSEPMLFEEAGPSIATSIWMLIDNNYVKLWPKVNIVETKTRLAERFLTGNFRDEFYRMQDIIWAPTILTAADAGGSGKRNRAEISPKAEDAFMRLHEYARNHPFPPGPDPKYV